MLSHNLTLIGLVVCAFGVLTLGIAYLKLLSEFRALSLGEKETVIEKSM